MKEKTISNFISCLCYSAIFGLAAATMPAMAQIPVNTFELDENTATNGNPDWEDPPAVFGFEYDVNPPSAVIDRTFTQGSKDIQDVSEWKWKVFNNVTPKDDIQHAYAAYVHDPGSGDDILYFGLDRLSAEGNGPSGGTTSFGFWAFGDPDVQFLADGTFDGEHKQGDIFIAGDMSGNSIDELRVYEWQGGDGLAGSLVEITANGNITPHCGDAAIIAGPSYDTDACGEINTSAFTPAWVGVAIDAGRFIEVGLNYNELTGNPVPCFNKFMATTRTSDSETASTKNFVLGGFPVCSIDVSKVCQTTELVDPFAIGGPTWKTEFLATVENDGGGDFSSTAVVTVTDAGADQTFGTADDIVVVRTVGDLTTPDDGSDGFDSGEFLDVPESGLAITGYYISTDNGGMNKVKATITDGSISTGSEVYTAQCSPLAIEPALYIEKDCDNILLTTKDLSGGALSNVGITVDYDIRACNTGQFALDVDLSDPTAGVSASNIILADGVPCGGGVSCPAGSSCVGYDAGPPEETGVCVNDNDPDGQLGPDPDDLLGSPVLVCTRTEGTYLLTGLAGGAMSATPYDAIFSNTATVSASEADNPLLNDDEPGSEDPTDDDIMESATAACPLCDEDDDHVPDYQDPDSGP